MEQEFEQEIHADYLKGFNEGYLLRQHKPALADSIGKALTDSRSERSIGFVAGCHEHLQEREQILSIPWMKKLPDDYDSIEPEQGKNRDEIEMEPE